MKIAVVHYHLQRGGVTRVIDSAVRALSGYGHEVVVLSGEAPKDESFSGKVAVVPGLNYRREGNQIVSSSLLDGMREAAAASLGGEPDVWHFHNHSLAKNVLIPTAVRELASMGKKVLLQMHDFSEDGRPGNYAIQRSFFDSERDFEETLYPKGKQVHYATIT